MAMLPKIWQKNKTQPSRLQYPKSFFISFPVRYIYLLLQFKACIPFTFGLSYQSKLHTVHCNGIVGAFPKEIVGKTFVTGVNMFYLQSSWESA